jgi:hypothetical protein
MASKQVLFDEQSGIHIYIKSRRTKSGVEKSRECEMKK